MAQRDINNIAVPAGGEIPLKLTNNDEFVFLKSGPKGILLVIDGSTVSLKEGDMSWFGGGEKAISVKNVLAVEVKISVTVGSGQFNRFIVNGSVKMETGIQKLDGSYSNVIPEKSRFFLGTESDKSLTQTAPDIHATMTTVAPLYSFIHYKDEYWIASYYTKWTSGDPDGANANGNSLAMFKNDGTFVGYFAVEGFPSSGSSVNSMALGGGRLYFHKASGDIFSVDAESFTGYTTHGNIPNSNMRGIAYKDGKLWIPQIAAKNILEFDIGSGVTTVHDVTDQWFIAEPAGVISGMVFDSVRDQWMLISGTDGKGHYFNTDLVYVSTSAINYLSNGYTLSIDHANNMIGTKPGGTTTIRYYETKTWKGKLYNADEGLQIFWPESKLIDAEIAFSGVGGDRVITGEVIKAALQAKLGAVVPSDYLDYITSIEYEGQNRNANLDAGNMTFLAAGVADNFTIKAASNITFGLLPGLI